MAKESVGAAWKKSINTKGGQVEILSIVIGDKKYTAWPNTFKKEGERSPDYRLQEDNYQPKTVTNEPKQVEDDLPF